MPKKVSQMFLLCRSYDCEASYFNGFTVYQNRQLFTEYQATIHPLRSPLTVASNLATAQIRRLKIDASHSFMHTVERSFRPGQS